LAFRNRSDFDVKITASQAVEMLSQICKQLLFKHRDASFTVFQIKTRHFFLVVSHPTIQINSTPDFFTVVTFFLTG